MRRRPSPIRLPVVGGPRPAKPRRAFSCHTSSVSGGVGQQSCWPPRRRRRSGRRYQPVVAGNSSAAADPLSAFEARHSRFKPLPGYRSASGNRSGEAGLKGQVEGGDALTFARSSAVGSLAASRGYVLAVPPPWGADGAPRRAASNAGSRRHQSSHPQVGRYATDPPPCRSLCCGAPQLAAKTHARPDLAPGRRGLGKVERRRHSAADRCRDLCRQSWPFTRHLSVRFVKLSGPNTWRTSPRSWRTYTLLPSRQASTACSGHRGPAAIRTPTR